MVTKAENPIDFNKYSALGNIFDHPEDQPELDRSDRRDDSPLFRGRPPRKGGFNLFWIGVIVGAVILSYQFIKDPPWRVPPNRAPTAIATPVIDHPTEVLPTDKPPTKTPLGPVTLNTYITSDIRTLDPQLAEYSVSISNIENLFLQLTNYDLETEEVVPEAAESWIISNDGSVYTFTIRPDIPWVNHNPITGETLQDADDEGNPRFVTAHDFVYGIQRACSPDTGSYYNSVVASLILGCEEVLYAEDPKGLTQKDYDAIQVYAVDDSTLVIELTSPSGNFLSMTPMWSISAVPSWAIGEHGDRWAEAGNIVTNGRFVLGEWIHGVRSVLVRNPLMPVDMAGSGNIERIVTLIVHDDSTGYDLWLAGEVDIANVPDTELQDHLANFPRETDKVLDQAVFYFSFVADKFPFDDKNVRAAFSASFDREAFIDTVRQGNGLPMIHFAPPGIFGAPPIDEVGVGFDPEFAAAKLAEAGYPGCKGFPQILLVVYTGQTTLDWMEFAVENWTTYLGCDSSIIQVEQISFGALINYVNPMDAPRFRAHIFTLGWGPDYADENNWVGDVLFCGNGYRINRACSEVDELILAAAKETNPSQRVEMYAEIENMFFGEDGLFPIAPLFARTFFVARHDWLDRIPALFGGAQYYNWTIDAEAQAVGK